MNTPVRPKGESSLRGPVPSVKGAPVNGMKNAAVVSATPARHNAAARQLRTMPEQIAERIYASITDGAYAPGDRIREELIAEQFGVSRAPVREALRILEQDSVVRVVPNRGAHVSRLSIKEVTDIFEIRRELFCLVVRRLNAPDAALLSQFEADVQELEALAADEGSTAAYVEVSVRLSAAIHDAGDNERLAEILASLSRQTRRYTRLALATPARRKESSRLWRAVFKALKAGDVDAAAAATAKLIDSSRREAVRQLEAEQAAASAQASPHASAGRRGGASPVT